MKLYQFNKTERFEKFCEPRIDRKEFCRKCPYFKEEGYECLHLKLTEIENLLEEKGDYNDDGIRI